MTVGRLYFRPGVTIAAGTSRSGSGDFLAINGPVEVLAARARARLSDADTRLVNELAADVAELHLDRAPCFDDVGARLKQELELTFFLCYSIGESEGSLGLSRWSACGAPNGLRGDLDLLVGANPAFGYYDPRRPERRQRNRSLSIRQTERLTDRRPTAQLYRMLERHDVDHCDQLRVLVCEDESLLAWFGGFRETPFRARERRVLQALVPSLQARLIAEAWLTQRPLHASSLRAALEAIPDAALLVDAKARVQLANSLGRAQLEADRDGVQQSLIEALARAGGRAEAAVGEFTLVRLGARGVPACYLATRKRPLDEPLRRANAARKRWALTPRQTEVLLLVAEGLSNRAIAVRLGRSEGTVELHVSALLSRVGAESRAQLVARFWKEL